MSWRRVKAVARRHMYVLQRKPQRWFDVVLWPVVDALLFGSIGVYLARQAGPGSQGVAVLLSGILLFHVVFQSEISVATGFMEETWSRNLLNLLVTPLREVEYVAGTVLFGLAKLALGVGVVGTMAFVLFAFNITDIGLALVPIIAVLLVVGWSVGLIVVGLILRVGQGAEILAWGLLAFVLPLSGAFYPVDVMPAGLQYVARVLPTTHVFAAARVVLSGRALPWGQLGWAALGTGVLAVLSVVYVTRMLSAFRARGFISRYT
ncbi:MAG: type transport system permease protein [Acidimicrobiaceae bacterium]|nr:type transport system permease protein [Acidimicrobiaceae bacterium]MDQ1444430.1 type transport system permease protein [Acidimicrobiaceae bacterium]